MCSFGATASTVTLLSIFALRHPSKRSNHIATDPVICNTIPWPITTCTTHTITIITNTTTIIPTFILTIAPHAHRPLRLFSDRPLL